MLVTSFTESTAQILIRDEQQGKSHPQIYADMSHLQQRGPIIQVFSEAVSAVSALVCFSPSLWLEELLEAYTKYNKRKITLEGVAGREEKERNGVGVGCCSYTHFKARLGLSGRIAVKSLYESDL